MKLIILDRDGVINQDFDEYIKSAEEWIPLPGSLEAIALLKQKNYHIAIASNQSGLARGLFSQSDLEAMHQKMQTLLQALGAKIDAIFICPHHPDDKCSCRKPAPGLLKAIAKHFGISLKEVPFVGDNLKDIEAAQAVGAKPILVLTGKGQQTKALLKNKDILIFRDLLAAAQSLP